MQLLWEIKKKRQIDAYIAHSCIYCNSFSSQREARSILMTRLILYTSASPIFRAFIPRSCLFFFTLRTAKVSWQSRPRNSPNFSYARDFQHQRHACGRAFFLRREKCITMPRNNSSWLINICATVCNLSSPISRTFRGPSRIFEEYIFVDFFSKARRKRAARRIDEIDTYPRKNYVVEKGVFRFFFFCDVRYREAQYHLSNTILAEFS